MPSQTIPFDYHSHHYRCGHAAGEIYEYIDAALARGMVQFGISDHGPAWFREGDHPLPTIQMARSQMPFYAAEARRFQVEYAGKIRVLVGIEADYTGERDEALASLLTEEPFDYALGSVHYVHQISVFSQSRWTTENPEETYAEYYRLVSRAARSGLFDILSHLTVVEAYGPPLSDDLATRLYTPVAEAVAESGCIVEVNTSGYRKMGGDEPFPNRRMLRLLIAAGVPLTFGSDCHKPDEVGYGRERVSELLHELGVDVGSPRPITVQRAPLLAFATR